MGRDTHFLEPRLIKLTTWIHSQTVYSPVQMLHPGKHTAALKLDQGISIPKPPFLPHHGRICERVAGERTWRAKFL